MVIQLLPHTDKHTKFLIVVHAWRFELGNTGQDSQKSVSSPFRYSQAKEISLVFDSSYNKGQNDECLAVIISVILFRHVLHHCAYVLHCGTVYWYPIGRLLIAWRLSKKN